MRCHSCRLVDHIAHQPVQPARRLPGKAILTQVLYQTGCEELPMHGTVVDGIDMHATVDQLPRPTTRRRTQICRLHALCQPRVPLIPRDKRMPGFFKLERRTAWRSMGKTQAANTPRQLTTITEKAHPQLHAVPGCPQQV